MRGVIEQAKHSKSGKNLSVRVGDTWYLTKHFVLETKVGQEIVFDPKPFKFTDGTEGQNIVAYTLAGESPSEPSTAPTPAAAPPPTRQVQASPPNNPYQPLVSNLAAHLIAAGKEPSELGPWFKACVRWLEVQGQEDPDDDIPF